MNLTFLGTAAMVPTKERAHPGIFLDFQTEGILIDCGESTQRQLKLAGIKPTKVTRIIITHWHGDHSLGLAGLIQTLSSSDYEGTLNIYGPAGTKKHFKALLDAFVFDCKIEIKLTEINEGFLVDNNLFSLEAVALEHDVPCFGVIFTEKDRRRINVGYVKKLGIPDGPLLGKLQEGKNITWKGKTISPAESTFEVQGKKIGIISDTGVCDGCHKIAKNVDLLISEATYTSKLEEKAKEYNHMTSAQAALVASQSNAKKLILTHFSQRYKTTEELEEDAKTYFDNVSCAYDLMKVKI